MLEFAKTPPKGWNSWDVYGASVTEEEVKRNADIMAAQRAEGNHRISGTLPGNGNQRKQRRCT